MASQYNCTQFLNEFPEPKTEAAINNGIVSFMDALVKAYRPFHYYVLTFIVIFAFFANILILILLTRKEMRYSGVNVTMMLIAVCDLGCAIAGLSQLYLRNFSDNYSSYQTAYAQFIVYYCQIAFHAESLYLAVGMAFCRVITLSSASDSRDTWQSPKYAIRVAVLLCFPVFAVSSFVLFLNSVKEVYADGSVFLDISPLSLANDCLFLKTSIFFSGSCFKILPSILMSMFSIIILIRIKAGKQRSNSLSHNQTDQDAQIDRSTRFIQVVVVVFVITETPQGFFSVLGSISINDYINYYQHLSIFMNILAFFNTTTSFIIYSTLSSKFRKLFAQLFVPDVILEKYGRVFQKLELSF
ncbi:G-protein coupled receptors family 1 profile domain-containing protein [Caenorhabditis elegans]|uniref:G-protein coupled receptors family 1 profile domain-containing protein n=1 Tax=Caenorhabditis elegans TaxID=6239 RepID=Q23293_CAEEL|nr:G-protein coupled receptors family 1 profile domain-containing protein [Caenorhabditis elegans]CCD72497.2 G-protein coupled receptors family 1 profile domain-containing protein [Caenorhabditis elegans]|eukprot:NP_504725.2 DroMyoSuppressin Receptor related [Caenorhabditis elegans]